MKGYGMVTLVIAASIITFVTKAGYSPRAAGFVWALAPFPGLHTRWVLFSLSGSMSMALVLVPSMKHVYAASVLGGLLMLCLVLSLGAPWRRVLCYFGVHEWWWMCTVTSDGIQMVRYQCFHCHKVKVKRR